MRRATIVENQHPPIHGDVGTSAAWLLQQVEKMLPAKPSSPFIDHVEVTSWLACAATKPSGWREPAGTRERKALSSFVY